jgi:acetolactate synthase-1/2/3 large subunit
VAEVRALLEAAERPLIIAGGNGWTPEGKAALCGFAEANLVPVLVDFRRQELIDNASPAYAGDAGLGKTPAVKTLIHEADLILALGTAMGEITTDGYTLLGIPRPVQKLIHVCPDAEELNKIYTADLPVHAHPDALMQALAGVNLPAAEGGAARMEAAHAAWAASIATPPQPGALDMGEVMRHLDAVLPRDAIMTNGAGNFAIWLNKHFPFTGARRLIAPQAGAMGYGVPAAIAAKVAAPDATVVCFAGDGDFQMSIPELGAAMQAGAQPVILVVNNRSYGTIRMHQERHYPGRVSFTDIENPDFAAIARAYGMHAERVTATAAFPEAFARALASPTGAVLDLVIDTESLTPRQTLSAIRAAASAG